MARLLSISFLTSTPAHTLRTLSFLSWFPAFGILTAAGVVAGRAEPSMAIIPHFFSAAYSLGLLYVDSKKWNGEAKAKNDLGITGSSVHSVRDLTAALGLLSCIIVGWVGMDGWVSGRSALILTSHGLGWSLFDFAIHTYFVVEHVYSGREWSACYIDTCSHCQHCHHQSSQLPAYDAEFPERYTEAYKPLLQEEVSTEGEQAGKTNVEQIV